MKCRFLILSAVLLSAAAIRSTAAELVEIRLHGHYFSEPATVRLLVTVEPDKANQTLRIEAEGDRLFRSTELNLAGDAEKRLHSVEFKNLPAGYYELRAQVHSATEVRAMATQELVVMGAAPRDK